MSIALSVADLTAGYGETTVLRDVSFEVPEGEVMCLMGRNGAGKTTLLRALMGVIPYRGTLHLEGRSISHWKGHAINTAGMVWAPQESPVFAGLTVRQHLEIASRGERTDRRIAAATSIFPVLGERLGQPAQTLSGGERKMLGIALAFVVDPKVVLMDEPTEGVAPVIVEQLIEAIRVLTETASVVLVEQNLDTGLALGSEAYVLEHGTIVESGKIRTLHDEGVLQRRLAV